MTMRAIVLMAKAPIASEAKTRLAAAIGADAAAALHSAFLRASVATATAVADELGAFVALMCPDERHLERLRAMELPRVELWAQTRPGLMPGITEAFERAFALGADTVVVGETDSPNLPAAHLIDAFRQLVAEGSGIVLGPCADGGYYLVGGRLLTGAMARDLFEGERYDGVTICRRTAERARDLGLWVDLGPEWYDVDTAEELARLQAELDGVPEGPLAELRAALASIQRASEVLE